MTNETTIKKKYYNNILKTALINNSIFIVIIAVINWVIDREMIPTSTEEAFKTFLVYAGMVLVITAYNYAMNRLYSCTFSNVHQRTFVEQHLEYLLYQPTNRVENWQEYEGKGNNHFFVFGNVFIKEENDEMHLLGPRTILKKIKARSENKDVIISSISKVK